MQVRKKLLAGLASLAALAGCATTPRIVSEFGSLYQDKEYARIQSEIYRGKINQNLIEKVSRFHNCPREEAEEFIEAQKNFYEIYREASKEKAPRSFIEFALVIQSHTDNTIKLSNSFEQLKDIVSYLDSSGNAEAKFKKIEEKIFGE